MRSVVSIAACALAACFSLQAQAQAFPSKQVTIIVGYPGGSPPEIEARLLGDFLSRGWGQPVVIEPRPGAATVIAHQALLNAPPDGHTLIFSSASISAFKVLVKDLPFEPMRDFAPVSLLVSFASGLATNKAMPAKTVAEFVAYSKANPGKVNYASAGQNTVLLIMEAFKQATGAPLTEIPYPGLPQYMTALLRNDVQLVQATANKTAKGQSDAGDLRMLVIVGGRRSPLFPDVPTSTELKLDIPRNDWQPILAHGKTPKNVLDTIAAQVMKYASDPDARRTAQDRGVELIGSTPEQLREQMETDSRLYAKVAAAIGLKPQ